MATLKEHQAAMVDLLANGSGIPASASRLAHAMHDLIALVNSGAVIHVTETLDLGDLKSVIRAVEANSPGLNDKALSKREKALKMDSPAKWPTPAEQRVKELENTIRQLKANNAKLKDTVALQKSALDAWGSCAVIMPEQAGCRKEDTQVCDHSWNYNQEARRCWCSKCSATRVMGDDE